MVLLLGLDALHYGEPIASLLWHLDYAPRFQFRNALMMGRIIDRDADECIAPNLFEFVMECLI